MFGIALDAADCVSVFGGSELRKCVCMVTKVCVDQVLALMPNLCRKNSRNKETIYKLEKLERIRV